MSTSMYWLGGLFLPLFPLSMIFNVVFSRVRNAKLRAALLLVWPQLGLSLVYAAGRPVPDWCLVLALFTSALYGFRAIGLREVGQWTGYLATSAWSLLWVAVFTHSEPNVVRLYAAGFSLPLLLLALLGTRLEEGFGAAYTGLYGGLAQTLPRMSGVLVGVILAIVAAPLFPAFSAMLQAVMVTVPTMPFVALTVGGVWLLWSWAGVRLLQGLIVGPAAASEVADLSVASTWVYTGVLILLLVGGVYLTGDLI